MSFSAGWLHGALRQGRGSELRGLTRRPIRYSVVLRLKKCVAAGAATAGITTDQINAACTGCRIGQVPAAPAWGTAGVT